jgi:hypothetical protein
MPPRIIDVPSTQSVKRCVYTVLQDVSDNTERHLPCLPLLVHTTEMWPESASYRDKWSGNCR